MKVFIARPFHQPATKLLKSKYDVEVWKETTTPPPEIFKEKVSTCHAIMTEGFDHINKEILASAKNLRIISNRAVGTDNIDIKEATQKKILVGNTPGVLHDSCADFTMGLILSLSRNIFRSAHMVKSKNWNKLDQYSYLGSDLHNKTIGIIGMGKIAQTVAKRCKGFETRILYFSRTRKLELEKSLGLEWCDDINDLLKTSDIVSLHLPLTDTTRHLIGKRELSLMKKSAFLINTSRGAVVNQNDLVTALKNNSIAGAALDVTDPEPIPTNHPLLTLDNLIITPHIASAAKSTFENMGIMAAKNIISALSGTPMPSCINPEALGE